MSDDALLLKLQEVFRNYAGFKEISSLSRRGLRRRFRDASADDLPSAPPRHLAKDVEFRTPPIGVLGRAAPIFWDLPVYIPKVQIRARSSLTRENNVLV